MRAHPISGVSPPPFPLSSTPAASQRRSSLSRTPWSELPHTLLRPIPVRQSFRLPPIHQSFHLPPIAERVSEAVRPFSPYRRPPTSVAEGALVERVPLENLIRQAVSLSRRFLRKGVAGLDFALLQQFADLLHVIGEHRRAALKEIFETIRGIDTGLLSPHESFLRKKILQGVIELVLLYDGLLPYHNAEHGISVARGAAALMQKIPQTDALPENPTADFWAAFIGTFHDRVLCLQKQQHALWFANHGKERHHSEGACAYSLLASLKEGCSHPPKQAKEMIEKSIINTIPFMDQNVLKNGSCPPIHAKMGHQEAIDVLQGWAVALADLEAPLIQPDLWSTQYTDALFAEFCPQETEMLVDAAKSGSFSPDKLPALQKYLTYLFRQMEFATGQMRRIKESHTFLQVLQSGLRASKAPQNITRALDQFVHNFSERYLSRHAEIGIRNRCCDLAVKICGWRSQPEMKMLEADVLRKLPHLSPENLQEIGLPIAQEFWSNVSKGLHSDLLPTEALWQERRAAAASLTFPT